MNPCCKGWKEWDKVRQEYKAKYTTKTGIRYPMDYCPTCGSSWKEEKEITLCDKCVVKEYKCKECFYIPNPETKPQVPHFIDIFPGEPHVGQNWINICDRINDLIACVDYLMEKE